MQFDPNAKLPKLPTWATYIPDRKPQFKIHTQKNHALNAFQYRDNGILYFFEDGAWKEVFRLEHLDKMTSCYLCNQDLRHPQYHYYLGGRAIWLKDPLRRVRVCNQCERENRGR